MTLRDASLHPGCRGAARSEFSGSSSRQAFDDFIFAFFAVEMVIKMIALGLFGQKCYLGDTWNRLDFFIVMAGCGPHTRRRQALQSQGRPEGPCC